MGVTMIAGTLGWIMDAPAATAYAVDPVGVDTISPANYQTVTPRYYSVIKMDYITARLFNQCHNAAIESLKNRSRLPSP